VSVDISTTVIYDVSAYDSNYSLFVNYQLFI